MSETEELLKERIFSLQRHKEEAEQVKYELQVSLQRLAAENVRLKDRLAGCREGEIRTLPLKRRSANCNKVQKKPSCTAQSVQKRMKSVHFRSMFPSSHL